MSVAVTGTPAANDSFSVTPAQKTDIFAMLDELARTLEGDSAIAGSAGGIPGADRRLHRESRRGARTRG